MEVLLLLSRRSWRGDKKKSNFLHQEPYREISEMHEAPSAAAAAADDDGDDDGGESSECGITGEQGCEHLKERNN